MVGKSVFDNINEYNENLPFPSVTLCPREKNSLVNVKMKQIIKDLNLTEAQLMNEVQVFVLFTSMANISEKLEKYSFSKLEVFPKKDSSSIM